MKIEILFPLAFFAAKTFAAVLDTDTTITGCHVHGVGTANVAKVGYYSDKQCQNLIHSRCAFAFRKTIKAGPGAYACSAADFPKNAPFYMKVEQAKYPKMQLVFTEDQTCPPSGPGAVFATLVDNKSCVKVNIGGRVPGLSVFPHGGSAIARVEDIGLDSVNGSDTGSAINAETVERRATRKCKGFKKTSSKPSESAAKQVSAIVDCTNGGPSGCTISKGQQHETSETTSYSLSAGGGVEGIFSVEATFGQEYTKSETTSLQYGLTVQKGQKGYLAVYSAATLFKGHFTGCDSGPSKQPGSVLALKKNGFSYVVVNTGA